VLLSIQSLLDTNPLDNEPGFANKKSETHDKYKACVAYETCRTLIIKNIFDIPEPFMCFNCIIKEHYTTNKDNIISLLNTYISESSYDLETVCIPVYRIKLMINFQKIKSSFQNSSIK
jgi:hypothetical protein